jgi:hypothetical protein
MQPARNSLKLVACPHCGGSIVVVAPSVGAPGAEGGEGAEAGPSSLKKLRRILLAATIMAGLLLVGVAYWSSRRTAAKGEKQGETPGIGGSGAGVSSAAGGKAGAGSSEVKSSADLKIGQISMERQAKSSLVYAIGAVTNASEVQRFGVRLELEILDQTGRPVGRASDYARVIEPRAVWSFRALMTDSHAAGARVSKITEEP